MWQNLKFRAIVKTISWRGLGTLLTVLVTWWLTGEFSIALAIGSFEILAKTLLFYVHERIWDRFLIAQNNKSEVRQGSVIWLTGLPSSGKTTIAKALIKRLQLLNLRTEWLDGDVVRDKLPDIGFSKEARDKHILNMGFLASTLEKHGVITIASFVSPYRSSRDQVRAICDKFIEVYISTSNEECEKRDVKGLYKKAREGVITQFTGVSDPYEPPLNPEIIIDTANRTVENCVDEITQKLFEIMNYKIEKQTSTYNKQLANGL